MDVESALREIDEANSKHVGDDGYDAQREEYRLTLEEVGELADEDAMLQVVRYVDEYIRAREERPAAGEVDRKAAEVVRERDVEIPIDSHLAPA